MIQLRPAFDRGVADFGWLQSRHSFSFGRYYNPNETGHGKLLVINDDIVAPGAGFGMHPHSNMEILSYVLEGKIAHKDSAGNEYEVPAGDFQLMSAGRGIAHSEYNASRQEPLRFLQIWILPNVSNSQPGYQQKHFEKSNGQQLILSPDGAEGSLQIKQNTWVSRIQLDSGQSLTMQHDRTQKAYLHLVKGGLSVNAGHQISAGDGLKVFEPQVLELTSQAADTEVLMFEV